MFVRYFQQSNNMENNSNSYRKIKSNLTKVKMNESDIDKLSKAEMKKLLLQLKQNQPEQSKEDKVVKQPKEVKVVQQTGKAKVIKQPKEVKVVQQLEKVKVVKQPKAVRIVKQSEDTKSLQKTTQNLPSEFYDEIGSHKGKFTLLKKSYKRIYSII